MELEKANAALKNDEYVASAIHNHTAAMYNIFAMALPLLYVIAVCAAFYMQK